MADQGKYMMNSFPEWDPDFRKLEKLESLKFTWENWPQRIPALKKMLRTLSSSFISRTDVRQYVFERDNYQCHACLSTDNLTVDHIQSVWKAIQMEIQISQLNTRDNLQTLCRSCNSKKNRG